MSVTATSEACKTDPLIESVFSDVLQDSGSSFEDAKELSHRDRQTLFPDSLKDGISYLYGEILPSSLQSILDVYVSDHSTKSFCDLGSGSGKVCITASVLYPFSKCTGIELLPNLHDLSTRVLHSLKQRNDVPIKSGSLEFILGDFLDIDWWSSADVVYICCTAFDDKLMAELAKKLERVRPGTLVFSVSHKIRSRLFEIVDKVPAKLSFGDGTVFVQVRKQAPRIESILLRNLLK